MTPLSLVPKMAKYKGISFDKLIEKIINDIWKKPDSNKPGSVNKK